MSSIRQSLMPMNDQMGSDQFPNTLSESELSEGMEGRH